MHSALTAAGIAGMLLDELATKFDVSTRTVRRDLVAIVDAGVRIGRDRTVVDNSLIVWIEP